MATKPTTRVAHLSARVLARVPPAKKAAFAALAASRGMTESTLLTLLVDTVLAQNPVAAPASSAPSRQPSAAPDPIDAAQRERVDVRLAPGDRKLIEARATARGMATSTYVAHLARAHLRADPALPEREAAQLEVSTRQIAAVGRNLNQIARALNAGGVGAVDVATVAAVVADAVARVEAGTREAAALVRASRASWRVAGDGR